MHVTIAIVGSGFGGLGMAIRLRRSGFDDFVILERAAALGGTWRDNTYPGCQCDVPSHLYSFSFAPNPHWSRTFSPQPEIWDYLEHCADRFDVRRSIRFGTEVRDALWDAEDRRWHLTTSGGPVTADVLISATGPLSDPSLPKLPGLETFQGKAFHSSRWDPQVDLTGRDVVVIGTGASAVQFVPEIQPLVRSLTVLQRTPPWVMARSERALSPREKRMYLRMPVLQRLVRTGIYWGRELLALAFLHPRLMRGVQRLALRNLHRAVADPALRAKLTPRYAMGCKRVLQSNTYYPALTRDNVTVVTSPVREVRPQGIVTADGVTHPADTIIFGTGFRVTDMPIAERIRGRDGHSLAEVWQGSPQAYQGTTVTGFPNLFLLLGPNTGLGHTSVVLMIESQIAYVIDALRQMRHRGLSTVEPSATAQREFVTAVDRRSAGTVWTSGGCRSWYLDATGRNSTVWPGYTWRFRQRMRRFDLGAYEVAR
jgi:cation diffusion facilitator CzcD-associated flavoprotein CzcO